MARSTRFQLSSNNRVLADGIRQFYGRNRGTAKYGKESFMNSAKENIPLRTDAADELNRVIIEHLPAQDELEFELGDTLDIKTSIVLVVIVFLAAQSGAFLAQSMPRHWHCIQMLSAACLVAAG